MTDDRPPGICRALHYVGFRGDEYARALRIFGAPDFIHVGWDSWARQEVMDGDVVVFARGSFDDPPSAYSFPDIYEAADDASA